MLREMFNLYSEVKVKVQVPIPVAARSKAWVFVRSHAGVVSSNSTGDMDG